MREEIRLVLVRVAGHDQFHFSTVAVAVVVRL